MMKKTSSIFIFVIVVFIILTVFFSNNLKNIFNSFLNIIYLKDNKQIVFTNDFIKNYIYSLENDVKEYKEIENLDNCINASIIYRSPSIWYDEFIINKGSSDNIKLNDIVINNDGLVGKINKVNKNSSSVFLITNTNTKEHITVGITNNNETVYGIISGYNKFSNEIIVSEVTKDINNKQELNVITTSFTNIYKEGIIIGNVKNIIEDSNGLSKKVIVTPKVDYNNIRYVCVLNNK